jgi:hypothetical protein
MTFTFARRMTIAAIMFLVCLAAACTGRTVQNATKSTVEGLVRDISCAIQNPRATAMNLNMQCTLECARNGAALIILTKDGALYVPMSNATPDKDERSQLMPFVGKYVKARMLVSFSLVSPPHTHSIDSSQDFGQIHLLQERHNEFRRQNGNGP